MITFACTRCSKHLRVPVHVAGKKIKCPSCQEPTAVPLSGTSFPNDSRSNKDSPKTETVTPITNNNPTLPPREILRNHPTLPPVDTQPEMVITPSSFSVEGYEILGEIGRGGMGVIYKARQLQPRRLVALKMILGGSHADRDQLTRFRREAETVARLQHPNIVQIYEIGEAGGNSYLALEFIEGGNLAQYLAKNKLSGETAAEILYQLAKGVHHAHQRQIIHRDLKPAAASR